MFTVSSETLYAILTQARDGRKELVNRIERTFQEQNQAFLPNASDGFASVESRARRNVGVNVVGGGHALVGEAAELAGDGLIPRFVADLPAKPRVRTQPFGHLGGRHGSGGR